MKAEKKYVDRKFLEAMEKIDKLERVFRKGGFLEKAVMDINGDIAWLNDLRESLSNVYDELEETHYGVTGHLEFEKR